VLTDPAISTLREDLVAAAFTLDGVRDRLGDTGLAGLERNSSFPAADALGDDTDSQADLIRLFVLGRAVPATRVRAALAVAPELIEAGLLRADRDVLRSQVELKPYGTDRVTGWICSDPTPLDGRNPRPRPDFVLGASPASTTLTQLVPPGRVGRVLDLGTGCGIQALNLDADAIVATDLNPRALDLARISLGLSRVDAELRLGSLYEPVAGERFDLIVTNPPYVISPPAPERLVYRETGFRGDDLMRRVATEAPGHLAPDGTLVVLGNWAITDRPWEDRLADWIQPTGCDALVLQRERLDVYSYIELWLADAGLVGTPGYDRRYAEWLDYFAASGITAVGMGWLALANSGRQRPEIRIEEWPHLVHQPVGGAIAAFFDAIDDGRADDADLLASRWQRHPGLVQETLGEPGAADPQHLVLRQHYGLGRALEPGTELAAIVGACDGELPLGALVDAVASLTGAERVTLRPEVLAAVRRLVVEGFLQRA
jgi:methylase of polypeptide subunit release factors